MVVICINNIIIYLNKIHLIENILIQITFLKLKINKIWTLNQKKTKIKL